MLFALRKVFFKLLFLNRKPQPQVLKLRKVIIKQIVKKTSKSAISSKHIRHYNAKQNKLWNKYEIF